jgi:hypothetical protein
MTGQRPGDLCAPPLAPGEADRGAVTQVRDMQIAQQALQLLLPVVPAVAA